MNHQEIRFQILHYLYDKHYSEQLGHPQAVEKIISETELRDVDKNIVYGDVVYLEQSGYVQSGMHPLGYAYPPWITITSYGIDTIDSITNQIIEEIKSKEKNNEIKSISDEPNPKTRAKKVWEYVKANPAIFINTVEKILKIFLSTSSY